jgi:glutamate dehydrogenase
LSIAERGGAAALPPLVRAIEILEESGRLNRAVEGLEGNEELLRRAQDNRGLTRPELAVLLSTSKLALQAALEAGKITEDPTLTPELCAAFPKRMQELHGDAIAAHRLRRQIIATRIANRFVNRLGITALFTLTEEEGASFGQAAASFVAAERLFDMGALWHTLDTIALPEQVRLELFEHASQGLQFHIADLLRSSTGSTKISEMVDTLRPGLEQLAGSLNSLLREEARAQGLVQRNRLLALGAPEDLAHRIVQLSELNGAIGIASLAQEMGTDPIQLTRAYTKLGEALALDWAQAAANRFAARDQWERLLTAGLARDFEQLRLEFLERCSGNDPKAAVDRWVAAQGARIDQFRRLVDRARTAPITTAPMLAQIATQARVLLGR